MKIIKLTLSFVILCSGVFAHTANAGCYSFPYSFPKYGNNGYIAKFEATTTSCPQTSGNRWAEVCVKVSGSSSSYNRCDSGYGSVHGGTAYLNLAPFARNVDYSYRLRYRKSNGSLGVGMYGSFKIP